MRTVTAALCLALLVGGPAAAAERQSTRALSCAALKALVLRDGEVVLASSETAYEKVRADGGTCPTDETGVPAFMPAADEPQCFVGWRCQQRSNEGSSSK